MIPVRVALYLRVSTLEQSFASQEKVLRDYCQRRGWKNLTVYREKKSRDDDTRPVMNLVMTDARLGKFDVLLVYKLDRWGSSLIHLLQTIKELATRKVGFVTATEGIDTTKDNAMAELQIAMMGWLAGREVSRIRERTRDGLAAARRKGRVGGRPRDSDDKIAKAFKLRGKKEQAEIAKIVGLSESYVSKLFKEAQKNETPKNKKTA